MSCTSSNGDNFTEQDDLKTLLGQPEVPDAREKLTKNITILRGVSVVLCSVIGTGIFITPNLVASSLNSPASGILVWFSGGLISLFGALTYAELAGIVPKSGSECAYLKFIYGPFMSFLSAFLMYFLWSGLRGSIIALTFVKYFWNIFVEDPDETIPSYCNSLLGVFVVCLISIVIIVKPTWVIKSIVFWTLLKVTALVVIIAAGFSSILHGNLDNIKHGFEGTSLKVWEWNTAWSGVVFTYFGWSNICCIASEVENPQRNIPIILSVSLAIVALLYCLTVTSFYICLPHHIISDPTIQVASEFGAVVIGPWGRTMISVAVAASSFGTLTVALLSYSRIVHAGAVEGVLPSCFSLVSKRFKTPVVAVLYIGVTAIICNFVGNVERFISSSISIDFPFYVLCAVGVFVLRRTHPHVTRYYKVPLPIPALFVLFGMYMFVLPFLGEEWLHTCVYLVIALLGVPLYYVCVADCCKMNKVWRGMSGVKDFIGEVLDCD